MAKFEFQVLRQSSPELPMVLADRCLLEAESTSDAANRYAELFNSPNIRRGDHIAPVDHPASG